MLKKLMILCAAAAVLVAGQALPASAYAQQGAALTNSEPLVIIRFNQRGVAYEKALYNALSRALEVKPTAIFDVVLKPGGSGSDAALQKVVSSMQRMNVPAAQMTAQTGEPSGRRYDVVNVYVR